jgi:hypothetical protein
VPFNSWLNIRAIRRLSTDSRRFPPPWSVELQPNHSLSNGGGQLVTAQALFVEFVDFPNRRGANASAQRGFNQSHGFKS